MMNPAALTPVDKLSLALTGMTERQRINAQIVANLCDSIRDDVLTKIERMPEEWDGHEIRELLADEFERERTPCMKDRKRKKAYRNERYQRNL